MSGDPKEDGSKATWAYVLGAAPPGHSSVPLGDLSAAPLEVVKALATQGPSLSSRAKLRTTDLVARPLSGPCLSIILGGGHAFSGLLVRCSRSSRRFYGGLECLESIRSLNKASLGSFLLFSDTTQTCGSFLELFSKLSRRYWEMNSCLESWVTGLKWYICLPGHLYNTMQ